MGAVSQYIIVGLIIAAAFVTVVFKAVHMFSNKSNNKPQCAGCPLADNCSKSLAEAKKCNDNIAQSRN